MQVAVRVHGYRAVADPKLRFRRAAYRQHSAFCPVAVRYGYPGDMVFGRERFICRKAGCLWTNIFWDFVLNIVYTINLQIRYICGMIYPVNRYDFEHRPAISL